jgi:hypothetical protein
VPRGDRGQLLSRPEWVSFLADHPRPRMLSDFKGGSKARCSSSTNSGSVAIPNAMALIEYHTVALEPVLEHPRLLAVSGLRRRAGPGPRCAEDCGEAFGPMHTRCLTRSRRAIGRQLTNTRVEHRSPAPSPLGQVAMARVDRAARVAKGQRGRQSMSRREMGLLFTRPSPRLVCCSDFKGGSKVPLLLPD